MTLEFPDRADRPMANRQIRLVLIEDSDADAYLVAEAARSRSYDLRLQRYVTAAEAIAAFQNGMNDDPHGVLLDLNLPAGSGIDVLRSIRGNEQTRGLPVVVMTSSISPRDREAAELIGVEGYLLKVSDYEPFLDAVDNAFRLILRPRDAALVYHKGRSE
jgi:two-component system response regulator